MTTEFESGRVAALTSPGSGDRAGEGSVARSHFAEGRVVLLPTRGEPPQPIGVASGADGREAGIYPVPGRMAEANRRIAGHEIGHAFTARALGSHVHLVTIIPDRGYEGRCVRSGPPSELTLSSPEAEIDEVLSLCERLERLTPEIGSARVVSAEYYVRAQNNIIELVAGKCAELLLHPELPPLGAVHDFVEAAAFARIAVAAQPAVAAMVAYAEAEATALLRANLDIVAALVEALVEHGTLSGTMVDDIISHEVAMRSIRLEHQRRCDRRARQESARAFLAEAQSIA
jgi:hypothetical protein